MASLYCLTRAKKDLFHHLQSQPMKIVNGSQDCHMAQRPIEVFTIEYINKFIFLSYKNTINANKNKLALTILIFSYFLF